MVTVLVTVGVIVLVGVLVGLGLQSKSFVQGVFKGITVICTLLLKNSLTQRISIGIVEFRFRVVKLIDPNCPGA